MNEVTLSELFESFEFSIRCLFRIVDEIILSELFLLSELSTVIFHQDNFRIIPVKLFLQNQGIRHAVLTHSHTMTPFDAPGKQAF